MDLFNSHHVCARRSRPALPSARLKFQFQRLWAEAGKIDNKQTGEQDRYDRNDRITPRAIRSLSGWRFFSEENYCRDEEEIKEQIGRDNVLEQLRINVSVGNPAGGRLRCHRARKC